MPRILLALVTLGAALLPGMASLAFADVLPLSCGQTRRGTIGLPGEHDQFTFTAAGGETIGVSTPGSADFASFRPCWRLFAPPPGAELLGGVTCGSDVRTLPRPGVYTIDVFDFAGDNTTGDYSVTLEALSGSFDGSSNATLTPTCAQPDVDGNPDDGTQPIACGETKKGDIEAAGETDTFTFTAAGGETVGVSTPGSADSASFRPCWQLFAPPPAPGQPAELVGGLSCGTDVRTLPRAGVYTIEVMDGASDNTTGSYTVTLEALSGSFDGNSNGPPMPICMHPDVDGNPDDGTQPIACGETKPGDIEIEGETDTFTFTAAGGETVEISTPGSSSSASFRPCWQLFAPPPAPGQPAELVGTLTCGTAIQTLPRAGIYTIEVSDGASDNSPGTYSVTLNFIGSCPTAPTTTSTTSSSTTTTSATVSTTTSSTTPGPVSIPGVFNTGVDDAGVVQATGTQELHYMMTGPTSPAFVDRWATTWAVAPSGAAWIATSTCNPPLGIYAYRLTFDLTGFDPATASISGNVASDNSMTLLLNGNDTGVTTGTEDFGTLTPFSLRNGFAAAVNVLEFQVTNTPIVGGGGCNPSGLLVANVIAQATRATTGTTTSTTLPTSSTTTSTSTSTSTTTPAACPSLAVGTVPAYAGGRVIVPVDLFPAGRHVAALNFTAGWGRSALYESCSPGASTEAVSAQQTCVPAPTGDSAQVLIVNAATTPIPTIPAGTVTDLLLDVAPGTAGTTIGVCIDPKSVSFGDTTGFELCVGPPTCGQVDVITGCNQQGDCNCDGKVNSGDRVCLISKFFDASLRGTCGCEDCNLSGSLNAADAPCITKCAFGQCPATSR